MKTKLIIILLLILVDVSCNIRKHHVQSQFSISNTHYMLLDKDTLFAYFNESTLVLRNSQDTFDFNLTYTTNNFYVYTIFYGRKQSGRVVTTTAIEKDSLELWFNQKGPIPALRNKSTILLPLNN